MRMIVVRHINQPYHNLKLDDVVMYDKHPYVVVAIGATRVLHDSSLLTQYVLQSPDERYVSYSTDYLITKEPEKLHNAQDQDLTIGNFIPIGNEEVVQRVEIDSLVWHFTDLEVNYLFKYVQMLPPEQVKQLIGAKHAQKIDGKIIKKDDKIIQVSFTNR